MRGALLVALLLCFAPLYAASPDPLAEARAAIASCTQRLDPPQDIGYDRIAARCPDLARVLERSEFEQWLPQGWKEARNNLSAGSLTELAAVVEREHSTRASARTPRVERLNEVLAGLGSQREEGTGAWARFKRWLRGLTEQTEGQSSAGWFDRMVSRVGISDAIVEIITYVALGAMVVLALIVVLNELKAAGLLGRRDRGETTGKNQGAEAIQRVPTFVEIERAPLVERPRMLLELIAARLTALRRLPPASAFTVRELTRSADLGNEDDRKRLANVAITAERARYAADGVPASALESAFTEGTELLKSVDSMRAPEAGVSA
jgi:hypothetical protein